MPTFPERPERTFREFLHKADQIRDVRLSAAIPKECFRSRPWRGMLGFAVSCAVYGGSVAGVLVSPPWAWPLLWIVAGLGGWGLHCIAHDCGHGSFSNSRRLNGLVGQVALLPLVYPFHAWRHVHNLHHAHTNSLELDTDWRPVPRGMYERMPRWERLLYSGTRTWGFWGGTINYWRVSAFRPSFFPQERMRRDVRRSMAAVILAGGAGIGLLTYLTGWRGTLVAFVAPWFAIHAWFSATTLMHHSAPDIPYLTSEHWTKNAGRLLVTTDYVYPRWLLFLTHNISIHTPHHVAPAVPFYNLRKAQQALVAAYPGLLRVEALHPARLWQLLRDLHLYDTELGFYEDFAGRKIEPLTGDGQATAPRLSVR